MRHSILLVTILFTFSCGNEKVLELPEISHSEITEIKDVSHAYLFYDETKLDHVDLNRKNLISTTNWLINVDKRLTLKQAIPHIKYLQDKKNNSSHKNKMAKNYFTCNDTGIKNLGFIDFTNITYYIDNADGYDITNKSPYYAHIIFLNLGDIKIITSDNKVFQTETTSFIKTINDSFDLKQCLFFLEFENSLTFQEYITLKSLVTQLDLKNITISNNEMTFN